MSCSWCTHVDSVGGKKIPVGLPAEGNMMIIHLQFHASVLEVPNILDKLEIFDLKSNKARSE